LEFTMSRQKSKSTPKKPKLIRDSFTIPKPEFAAVEILKSRAVALGSSVKKSELLRAGLKLLAGLSDAAYLDALAAVPTLKTGRPRKEPTKTAEAKPAPGKTATGKRAVRKLARPAAPATPTPSAAATPVSGAATQAVRAPRKRAPAKSATARRPAATPRKAAGKKAPLKSTTTSR
jgi:hypothetical protein